jgi:hypothetical protein
MTPTTCVLILLTSTGINQIPNLEPKDATKKFWEYNDNLAYPTIATEAVYCGKKLILIQNQANTGAVPGGINIPSPSAQPGQ